MPAIRRRSAAESSGPTAVVLNSCSIPLAATIAIDPAIESNSSGTPASRA